MDPFNIRIKAPEQVSLTVLPTDEGYYKIIYYAAVLSAVEKNAQGDWQLLEKDNIIAGDLPYYIPVAGIDHIATTLDDAFAKEAGAAIDEVLQTAG